MHKITFFIRKWTPDNKMKAIAKPNSLNLEDKTQSRGKLRKAMHSGWSVMCGKPRNLYPD